MKTTAKFRMTAGLALMLMFVGQALFAAPMMDGEMKGHEEKAMTSEAMKPMAGETMPDVMKKPAADKMMKESGAEESADKMTDHMDSDTEMDNMKNIEKGMH